MWLYKIHNLYVQSECSLGVFSEIQIIPSEPDIVIRYHVIPDFDPHNINGRIYPIDSMHHLFAVADTGYIQVNNGNDIQVFHAQHASFDALLPFILGRALGYALVQRNIVAVHGSGLCLNSKGIIIAGHSGAGKSTTSECLQAHGARFIADDTCSITENNGICYIHMAYPQKKISTSMARELGYDLSKCKKILDERDKRCIDVPPAQCIEESPLSAIYILNIDSQISVPMCQALCGAAKFMTFMEHIYMRDFFQNYQMPPIYMNKISQIINTVPLYLLSRPVNCDTTDQIVSMIQSGSSN